MLFISEPQHCLWTKYYNIAAGSGPAGSSSSVVRQMNPETKATLEALAKEFPV